MTLIPDPNPQAGPGQWVNPEWQPGMPGTFAVIIGASRYRHLDGGDDPTDDAGVRWIAEAQELGQLHVSALTAFHVFTWLTKQYWVEEAPPARCWLLLAPTDAEKPLLKMEGEVTHYAEPTFANCDLAIRSWHEALHKVPGPAATHSRGLFFFSGHGIEKTTNQHILLPSDYLRPPAPNINMAISTQNLQCGVTTLPIERLLFLVDACRSDSRELRGKNVTGSMILTEDEAAQANPVLTIPVLYASASGQRAWERRDPVKGISLFGEAILDGLRGTPNIQLRCDERRCAIDLFALFPYAYSRVLTLLKELGSKEQQYVRLGGQSPPVLPITYVKPRPARPIGLPHELPPILPYRESADSAAARFTIGILAEQTPEKARPADPAGIKWATDFREAHDLFGREPVTELWQRHTSVWSATERKWLAPDVIRLHEVARNVALSRYRVQFSFQHADPLGHWLQFVVNGKAHACLLPSDRAQPIFEIAMDFEGTDRYPIGPLTRLEAQLANRDGPLHIVAELWQRYEIGQVAAASLKAESLTRHRDDPLGFQLLNQPANGQDPATLRSVVAGKMNSPLAAVLACLVLMRMDRWNSVPTPWLRNVANWFPELPDGAVLYAERRFRESRNDPGALRDAAHWLAALADRGPPRTSEGFDYAVTLLNRLKRLGYGVGGELEAVDGMLDALLPFYRPGGLFGCFLDLEANVNPQALLSAVAMAGSALAR